MAKNLGRKLLLGLILVNCTWASAWAQSADLTVDPDQLVVAEMSDHGISWQVLIEVESIRLKVAGPSGIVAERRFDPTEPLWYDLTRQDGSLLPDGAYKYELRVARKLSPDEEQLRWEARELGVKSEIRLEPVSFRIGTSFRISGGIIDSGFEVPETDQVPVLRDETLPIRSPMDEITGDFFVDGGLCTGCEEAIALGVPDGDAHIRSGLSVGPIAYGTEIPDGVLQVKHSAPYIHLDGSSGTDWYIRNSSNGFEITDIGSPWSAIKLRLEPGLPSKSFHLDSEGKLGLGTSLPDEELHITGKGTLGDPTIHFEATGITQDEYEWSLGGNESSFSIRDETEGRTPFFIQVGAPAGSISVTSKGRIGLGIKTPEVPLHVRRSDGTAQIMVEDTSGATAVRTQFQLKNNGAPRFALENTSSGIEWSFQQSGPGNFLISKEGTGGPELQVFQTGRVRMGPAGAINFDLTPSGDLTIAGSLTANGSVFPDYVFEPDYELMPLSELSSFIEEEKRLPKIPSAQEIQKKGGHNMTELQLQLLEKIEELTLYTLEQEQRIRALEAQVKEMGGLQN